MGLKYGPRQLRWVTTYPREVYPSLSSGKWLDACDVDLGRQNATIFYFHWDSTFLLEFEAFIF